jgi:hypothetical protein
MNVDYYVYNYYVYTPKWAARPVNWNRGRAEQLVEDALTVQRRAREAKHDDAAEIALEAAVSANLAADYYVEVYGGVTGRPSLRRAYARAMARRACEAMARAKMILARAVEALEKSGEAR